MNERIKELANMADDMADDEIQMIGEYHPDWHDVRDSFFVELIVKECMSCVDACESEIHCDHGMVPIIDVNDRIKQHFGIA